MSSRFTSPPDVIEYNNLVWELVRQIPVGKVATYGQIAGLIPPPNNMNPEKYRKLSPRWVGGAMAACPDNVPWQRVIGATGKISFRRGGGHHVQREILESEGVTFDDRGKVDLKAFGWKGLAF